MIASLLVLTGFIGAMQVLIVASLRRCRRQLLEIMSVASSIHHEIVRASREDEERRVEEAVGHVIDRHLAKAAEEKPAEILGASLDDFDERVLAAIERRLRDPRSRAL